MALILSLAFFDFKIIGTREGIIISSLLIGIVVKLFNGKLKNPLNHILAN